MTRWKQLRIIITIVFLIICSVVFLNLRRPVVKTDEWTAVITATNGQHETISVYKMWGFPDRLLVELPEQLRGRYHWFGIESGKVTLLPRVGNFPYRHYNHDKAFGLLLDKANHVKIEDDWNTHQEGKKVHFSNADFKISVTPKNKD